MMVPLYGFLQGDTMGLTIVVHDTDTVEELADKLKRAAHVRCRMDEDYDVVYRGVTLDRRISVGDAGFEFLDRFDVVRRTNGHAKTQPG